MTDRLIKLRLRLLLMTTTTRLWRVATNLTVLATALLNSMVVAPLVLPIVLA